MPVSQFLLDNLAALLYDYASTPTRERCRVACGGCNLYIADKGPEAMQLSIEPNNGIPIYEQLVRQIKYAVAEGILVPGQVIPSVRDMAKQLTVNPNTVQRAYLQLQSEEVLQSLRGRGVAVCDGAKKQCVADRHQLLADRLAAVLDEAIRSGLDEERLRTMFEKALKNAVRNGEKQS